ncbi:hypothetical protein ACF060_32360 [Streptomyces werraensis]|uniref:hypothetical protein n=1 Tax=Streptomyces werraensis TaxID=68284 RepID=UPI0036F8AEBE
MPDRQQRRARLRLARQRAAPARVRPRERADAEQSAEQPSERRFSWVTLGAALGGIAAIGSLGFTGIATYYGARVAADQLEQSREDAEREQQAQAKTFSYWVEFDGLRSTLHIQNRSPDPIPQVHMELDMDAYRKPGSGQDLVLPDGTVLPQEAEQDEKPERLKAVVRLETFQLGPCAKLSYSGEELSRFSSIIASGGSPETHEVVFQDVIIALFVDREGQWWKRTKDSLSPMLEEASLYGGTNYSRRSPGEEETLFGLSLAKPKVSKATSCDTER